MTKKETNTVQVLGESVLISDVKGQIQSVFLNLPTKSEAAPIFNHTRPPVILLLSYSGAIICQNC